MIAKAPVIEKPKKTVSGSLALVLLFVAIGCFSSGGIAGYLLGASQVSNGNGIQPTPTAMASGVTITPTVSEASPTPSENNYENWQKYILADCQVSLLAPNEWVPGKRGENNTCGSFSSSPELNFTSFTEAEGVYFVFVQFNADSIFGVKNFRNVAEYMKSFQGSVANKLIEKGEKVIADRILTYAVIERDTLGITYNLFYEQNGKEFVIMWGGKEVTEQIETIDLLLNSIEFI